MRQAVDIPDVMKSHRRTNMLFEELAVRAETDDMDSLARDAAQVMNQCLACHAAFRVH